VKHQFLFSWCLSVWA